MTSPFQANRVANSGRNFARPSGPRKVAGASQKRGNLSYLTAATREREPAVSATHFAAKQARFCFLFPLVGIFFSRTTNRATRR